jgi:chromosome segregation ATPase
MSENQPVPQIVDPTTVATDAAMVRALAAERDYVDGKIDVLMARLDGMDEAAKVLHETVTRTPTDIQQAVGHLKELQEEKFASVQTQFKERDTRSERESRDNAIKVDAAFAAQKEAAAKESDSNTRAIEKSERATEKVIDALNGKIDDLKERLGRVEGVKEGGSNAVAALYAGAATILAVVAIAVTIIIATR